MNKIKAPKVWDAIGYVRLSKDDRDGNESNSIKNQRDLILDFAARNPDVRIAKLMADDGFTGANFDRDAFKDMVNHIENGAVNCVIVKDFSRLGRDHIEMGKYIERYFDSKNVRFISINDSYDSLKSDMSDNSNSLIVPFKNIINEAFLEDISLKTKSQLAVKRKNGEFIGNYTVFGYLKSSDKKLIVDECAAEVVSAIFEHKLLGKNEQQIADSLNEKGILSPAEYKKASGQSYSTPFATKGKSLWTANSIKRILQNRIYIGHLEQGKRTKVSYRMKKTFYKPREAWSVHENNHEPIISEHTFEIVQELLKKDTRVSGETGRLQLFSGLIFCGACGQPMTVKTTKKNGKCYINYICSTHKRFGTCKNNNVSGKTVEQKTLLLIKKLIESLTSVDNLSESLELDTLKSRKKAVIDEMIEKALRSVNDYNGYLVKSYTHMLEGVITEVEYRLLQEEFNHQIQAAEKNIEHLRGEIKRLSDDTKTHEIIEQFKKHGNITELNRLTVVSLIKSVTVYDNKDIEIQFRYIGNFEGETEQEKVVV